MPRCARALAAATAALLGIAGLLVPPVASGEQLLAGSVDPGTPFALYGESREEIIGGEMLIGERRFVVTDTSRLGLIGASRVVRETPEAPLQYGEYAVFSSSFSEQTAVGEPWTAAREYRACDVAYNSFLAVYRVDGASAVAALGDPPYGPLTQDKTRSDEAVVYCFMSRPPAAP